MNPISFLIIPYLIFSIILSSRNNQTSVAPTSVPIIQSVPTSAPDITYKPETLGANRQEAMVIGVIDGDTINVLVNGISEKIRLIGIDTPETVDPRQPIQCYGKEAANKIRELVGNNVVILESDATQSDRDKYERLLRYVFLDDGTDVGKTLIEGGYAHEYTYDIPYAYQQSYRQAERIAETNKRGLWSSTACPSPTVKPITNPTKIPTLIPTFWPTKKPTTVPTTTSLPINQPTERSNNNSGGLNTSYDCNGPDLDCGDFSTHAEAQGFFNECGFTAANDPMRLDGRGNDVDDGIACESLP